MEIVEKIYQDYLEHKVSNNSTQEIKLGAT